MTTVSPELSQSVRQHTDRFYIDGAWVGPAEPRLVDIVNPATEAAIARVALGGREEVDRAVTAARTAFETFSITSVGERIALLGRVIAEYERRADDIALLVSREMGAPITLATQKQVPAGLGHLKAALAALRSFQFEEQLGKTTVVYEPVGVCALITPWNWPLNQIGAKVAPALATGCSMVLKPSEIAPLSAIAFAEVLDAAGVPGGVFNLVNGDGPTVGRALAEHPGVDMVSFTGSTRAGIDVAAAAAPTVKRVTQELGGKSANIILQNVDLAAVLKRDIGKMYNNSGQSCNAGTRVLVPSSLMDAAIAICKREVEALSTGDPDDPTTTLGPVVSETQYRRVQALIEKGVGEGATLVTGGPGRPDGLPTGYYVRPTVFGHVTNDMTIAREEIFGPVLSLIGYETVDEAVAIANDSDYGLAGMVSSDDHEEARRVARRIRTGMVHINGTSMTTDAPFGGYKKSGNGREFGAHGFREFLEAKSIYGDNA